METALCGKMKMRKQTGDGGGRSLVICSANAKYTLPLKCPLMGVKARINDG